MSSFYFTCGSNTLSGKEQEPVRNGHTLHIQRGNLNISCSLSPSSLLAVPLSCPHHWPAVYNQLPPSVRSSPLCLICLIIVVFSFLFFFFAFRRLTRWYRLYTAEGNNNQQSEATEHSFLKGKYVWLQKGAEAEFSIIKCFKMYPSICNL